MTTARHAGLWIVVGIAAVSLVMLNDVGRLLGDIQSNGLRSYGAGVFTGFKLFFLDTSELAEAIELWRKATLDGFDVQGLLSWHLRVDALFIPSYCLLIWLVLRRVRAKPLFALGIPALLAVFDWAETRTTYHVLVTEDFLTDENWLKGIQTLSFVKWGLLATALVTAFALWRKPNRVADDPNDRVGETTRRTSSAGKVLGAVREALDGKRQHPAIALFGLIVLIALFVALVALPAGGPLEQLPDVLRSQLSREEPWSIWVSLFALLLLAGTVAAAGLASTNPAHTYAREETLSSTCVVIFAAFLSIVLFGFALRVDGPFPFAWGADHFPFAFWGADHFSWVPLSPFLVVLCLTAAAGLGKLAGVSPERLGGNRVEAPPSTRGKETTLWVGALAGVVVVAGGLVVVRAAFLPMVLEIEIRQAAVPWWMATVAGAVAAIFGGFLVQLAVAAATRGAENSIANRSAAGWFWLGPPAVVAALLSTTPSLGRYGGTAGVVAIGFAFLALVIGLLKWLSRSKPRWEVTYSLGFGMRTPWLALVIVTWVVASIMNTDGVYHDARVGTEFGPSDPLYPDLNEAFRKWQIGQCAPIAGDPVPMVLVAAPGGGIRAAYWTAATLDELFGPQMGECAARGLFAVSGVSGGSIGATTWVLARADGTSGKDAVEEMSNDHGLAAAAAGLLLRDLLQPFTGITTGWRNRAALLEDSWIESADVYGSVEKPSKWSDVGQGRPGWVPLLVLNASSVTDGCRVLLANVGALPAATGSDCGASPLGDQPTGPISGSIDPFPGLYKRGDEAECDGAKTGMRTITAALLSARFPYLSPSGALLRCVSAEGGNKARTNHLVTYTVDGGYYENSGLLTLLQMWAVLEPMVRQHNDTLDTNQGPIAPWIVVADNHYRSKATAAQPRRPRELIAPLSALSNTLSNNAILSQTALEQTATFALSTQRDRCTTNEAEDDRMAETDGEGFTKGVPSDPKTVSCLVVIAPTKNPSVAAPLGWVLSETSRSDLDTQLARLLPPDGPPPDQSLKELLRQLARRS